MKEIILKGKSKNITIGYPNPIAVNVNVGVSSDSLSDFNEEKTKINYLLEEDILPDLMMDLSLNVKNGYLYDNIIKEIGCPVGYIPHYTSRRNNGVIDKISLLDEVTRAAESGISWFVLHLTPSPRLVALALKRKHPFASRSAIIEIEDMILSNRKKSIYWELLDDIISICIKHSISISLGAAFRPGIMDDALDEVHLAELYEYSEFINFLESKGVNCFIEGIGHCNITKIKDFNSVIKEIDRPFMPLGPLFSDNFNNDDHIINAISFYTGIILGGRYSIINSITPVEHSGGIPNTEEVIVGYRTARCCARMCNEFLGIKNEHEINNFCLNDNYLNCSRCEEICPNKFTANYKRQIKEWMNSN